LKTTLASVATILFLAACGGSQPPAESPPDPAAEPPPAETPAEAPMPEAFDDMNRDQRMMFMKQTVLPTMQAKFQEFDATRYAEFSCATCHGAGAKDGSFKMPNPNLPKLPSTPEGFTELAGKKPEAAKFMGEVVTPTMTELLHEEPFDMATGKGFGCMECHTTG
jgi:hypothetical protein